jgi:hypothetical protein
VAAAINNAAVLSTEPFFTEVQSAREWKKHNNATIESVQSIARCPIGSHGVSVPKVATVVNKADTGVLDVPRVLVALYVLL